MILINGKASDTISATDRGFQYGDGLFETMAIDQGIPLCLFDHLARLARGCQRLRIPQPARGLLQKESRTVASNVERGVLKIIITRGVGGRGYAPPPNPLATRFIADFPWPDYPASFFEEGIETALCETRLARNPGLAGIKHLNRLEQVLGKAECVEKGVPEGIMLDTEGNLIEGVMSNLFLIRGNELMTPSLASSGVQGIVRDRIIRVARETAGMTVGVTKIDHSVLPHADGIFFCNSIMGIWPVKKLAQHRYPIPSIIRWLKKELIRGRIICR
uniref:Aminodeoxychorismate lyase n=1 Tax=Candidatus Kentrum sp. MB TaxID=2138164 RepID=A0A450XWF2_9GAMM|nr:MAG: aminodeoxychorismate lyase apoprotein [Candidatus Kentron sp. MB]VFK76337.1 MAG: aminodeoxychorismate lyase apoprotein [Candidatus Kentron sp. MB]